MKATRTKRAIMGILTLAALLAFAAAPAMSDQVTIKGTVTDDFQIVDDAGQSYDVVETSMGDELVAKASGKTVEVTGTLQEEAGVKSITVDSYKIIEE